MKRMIAGIMVGALVFTLAGCGRDAADGSRDSIAEGSAAGQDAAGARETASGETGTDEPEPGTGTDMRSESETGAAERPGTESGAAEEDGANRENSAAERPDTEGGAAEQDRANRENSTAEEDGANRENSTAEQDGAEPESSATEADSGSADGTNALVVYFSWSGNTENVANAIAEQTGADIFEIIPEEAYIDDYDALLDIASQEKQSGARPAIAGSIEDIARYEVIYVGYPNWWSDMPMILYTFFDSYDLSGKTIAPFCTSGGSGLSGTVDSIKELEPDADVLEGLHIGSSSASDPEVAVSAWLESLDITE